MTNLDYVLDVTIAYPDGGQPLDILDIVAGIRDPCQTHFFYRLYHTSEVTTAEREDFRNGIVIVDELFLIVDSKGRVRIDAMAVRSVDREGGIPG